METYVPALPPFVSSSSPRAPARVADFFRRDILIPDGMEGPGMESRVVRVSLHCSPCGQVRLPPERCRGHIPDCMNGITVDMVLAAAAELLGPPLVPSTATHAAGARH